MSDLAS